MLTRGLSKVFAFLDYEVYWNAEKKIQQLEQENAFN